jgi:hypothetical protein
MLLDAHRQHAESLEAGVSLAQAQPQAAVALIENAWGAAFHWICYGCERRHQQHRDNHQGLAAYLNGLGEASLATRWRTFEALRTGGFYGSRFGPTEVAEALTLLQQVRDWATI